MYIKELNTPKRFQKNIFRPSPCPFFPLFLLVLFNGNVTVYYAHIAPKKQVYKIFRNYNKLNEYKTKQTSFNLYLLHKKSLPSSNKFSHIIHDLQAFNDDLIVEFLQFIQLCFDIYSLSVFIRKKKSLLNDTFRNWNTLYATRRT